MRLLSIENLCLSIHQKPVLKNIHLKMNAGEIHAITGESGSGKSMTALSVMRLLPNGSQTKGHIEFNGTDVLGQSEKQMCAVRGNEIGMVFQEPMTALNPVKTIGDQVRETIVIHTAMSKIKAEQRAREVLTRVGLPQDKFPLSRYPYQLSGGQRQRVVIAIAIALRPRLLIADEPTTALDVTTQAKILDLLSSLVSENNMAMLMISHDLAVVAELAQHISVMYNGEIIETAGTHSLLGHMQHDYTKALFAASHHVVRLPEPEATPSSPLLKVQNISKDYRLPIKSVFAPSKRYFRALKNVSFEIARGERVGLVGESGCGKSTLARAILGLEDVQEGHILLQGQPVYRTNKPNLSVRRKMQVVFQDPFGSFNPRHKVGRLISEPFHLLPKRPSVVDRQRAISETLTAVGLHSSDAEKYIHEFSGGQRQRIAIARAIIIRPHLILFDEAVSALDVSVRARIMDLLADLCKLYDLTYIFISHDLHVVRSITDRVLIMNAGEIVERGAADEVLAYPTHPYTKALVAAAPKLPYIGTISIERRFALE
ncbi:MAG: dipeptide ABC transporter ATP-binding protein [Aestuariivita sp.]|nr:dipeptide ABC transporter ATP-binding protein [Aestuariivita sp.]